LQGSKSFLWKSICRCKRYKITEKDAVISLAILNGINFNVNERDEYLKISSSLRKNEKIKILIKIKLMNLKSKEEFLLSVTDKGFGKRSSAYEYRKSNRGGLGIANMQLSQRNGSVKLLPHFQ
jgi:DNA gyrase subunit A